MTSRDFVFSSESVGEGHPDKVADQISDGVLDEHLRYDKFSRVACETMVKNNMVILAGEITSSKSFDYEALVRKVVKDIGYDEPSTGFDCHSCSVQSYISQQSADISQGVTEGEGTFKEQGAGDQGMMFGFACDETPELMPMPISLSHQLMRELTKQRKAKVVNFIKPDAKCQVSVHYENGRPKSIESVVLSTQHSDDVDLKTLESYIIDSVIKKVIPANYLSASTRYLVNPTGRFVVGGPVGDCGLTGRKIIVDTYGGYSRHGGGAFSGKDPSKVDRSAAYAARYAAKNIVAAGLASKCEVQVAYAIGVAEPVSIFIDTFGTGKVSEEKLMPVMREIFELKPRGIISSLNLLKPIYQATSSYGHFGRDATAEGLFPWERTDKTAQLKSAFGV